VFTTTAPLLNVIQYPSGRWGFVGRIPLSLAFAAPDGSPADPKEADIRRQFGGSFGRVKARSWESRAAAIADAKALGFEVA
jgi:hypothetical protein